MWFFMIGPYPLSIKYEMSILVSLIINKFNFFCFTLEDINYIILLFLLSGILLVNMDPRFKYEISV
jgi:hypothetical protein